MGSLRLLLALCVVVVHAYPLWGFTGLSSLAVHSFFVISGFYMSLILTEKYIKKFSSYKLFITNRFLRIYPLYWLILLLTFTFSFYKFLFVPNQESYIHVLVNYFSTSPFFTFEMTMTVLRNISLIFSVDYFRDNFGSPGYLLVQPAWTLQIEFLFYLMAPFIVKFRTNFIIFLTIIFSIITFGFQEKLSPTDSSLTIIFITKFVYFLFGILSYRLYVLLKQKKNLQNFSLYITIAFPFFVLLFGNYYTAIFPTLLQQKIVLFFYFLILMICLAFLFIYTKNKTIDRAIGELSYPVYLSHQFVFKMVNSSPLAKQNHELVTLSCIFITLIVAFVLTKTVENPIDRLRQKMLH